jgi:hypothetical protein
MFSAIQLVGWGHYRTVPGTGSGAKASCPWRCWPRPQLVGIFDQSNHKVEKFCGKSAIDFPSELFSNRRLDFLPDIYGILVLPNRTKLMEVSFEPPSIFRRVHRTKDTDIDNKNMRERMNPK